MPGSRAKSFKGGGIMATKIRVAALIAALLVLVAGTFFASACGRVADGTVTVTKAGATKVTLPETAV